MQQAKSNRPPFVLRLIRTRIVVFGVFIAAAMTVSTASAVLTDQARPSAWAESRGLDGYHGVGVLAKYHGGVMTAYCTAAPIDRAHLLTAAHCFEDGRGGLVSNADQFGFRINPDGPLDTWAEYAASAIFVHPRYQPGVERSRDIGAFRHEIAVVRLATELESSIPTYELLRTPLEPGASLRYVGYGRIGTQETGEQSNGCINPRRGCPPARRHFATNELARVLFDGQILRIHFLGSGLAECGRECFLTGAGRTSSRPYGIDEGMPISGDSGSPVFYNPKLHFEYRPIDGYNVFIKPLPDKKWIVGVHSHGLPFKQSGHIAIAPYIDWIRSHTNQVSVAQFNERLFSKAPVPLALYKADMGPGLDSIPPGFELEPGRPLEGLLSESMRKRYFYVLVPEDPSRLRVHTVGDDTSKGDVDLYVRFDGTPSLRDRAFDCAAEVGGNFEECVIEDPSPGMWQIMLHGLSDYAGVSLIADLEPVLLDTTPDEFSFPSRFGVTPGSVVTSDAVVPVGYSGVAAIAVTNGSYSVNCADRSTTLPGTIVPGESVCVRHTAAAGANATVITTLTVGGVSGTFSSTTSGEEDPPGTEPRTPSPDSDSQLPDAAPGGGGGGAMGLGLLGWLALAIWWRRRKVF